MFGELIPGGGGDPIPLLKPELTVGRRESCDIVLRFGNVSGQHCELTLDRGWWFVKDLGSQNGTRVNGLRVSKKRLDPGDRISIARLDYEVRYSPAANGGDETTPPEDDVFADIMGRSLLESAGLDRRKFQDRDGRIGLRRSGGPNNSTSAGDDSGDDRDADDRDTDVRDTDDRDTDDRDTVDIPADAAPASGEQSGDEMPQQARPSSSEPEEPAAPF